MNRGKPLARRTPLRADVEKQRAWQRARKALAPRSAKVTADLDRRREVREAVFTRDRWTCRLATTRQAGSCFGPLTPHHLRKASAGGGYTEENLVTLCAGHNTWVEDHPIAATMLGLVER